VVPLIGAVFLYICVGIGLARALTALQSTGELHIIHANRRLSALFSAIALYAGISAVVVLGLSHVGSPAALQRHDEWAATIADPEKLKRLEKAAGRAGLRVRFADREDPRLDAQGGGVDGALARLLAIVAASVENGQWERLKACPRDPCFWAFYDRSKNRSGRWCRMEECGNIEKARAFRERRRGARG